MIAAIMIVSAVVISSVITTLVTVVVMTPVPVIAMGRVTMHVVPAMPPGCMAPAYTRTIIITIVALAVTGD